MSWLWSTLKRLVAEYAQVVIALAVLLLVSYFLMQQQNAELTEAYMSMERIKLKISLLME